jgi:hypothetical protein
MVDVLSVATGLLAKGVVRNCALWFVDASSTADANRMSYMGCWRRAEAWQRQSLRSRCDGRLMWSCMFDAFGPAPSVLPCVREA